MPVKNNTARRGLATRAARAILGTSAAVLVLGGLGAGCLSRPVTTQAPTTKDNFATDIRQSAIDKVDLLFDIDNSASMGDKQAYLSAAVPDLLNRLVQPYCVDANGAPIVAGGNPVTSDIDGNCSQGKAEFKPVHDMHIGVVSSSLGTRGGDLCDPSGGADNDTKGELISRGTQAPAVMSPSNFLNWFPSKAVLNQGKTASPGATPIEDTATLEADFADLVSGTGQAGCGIESQLESWYRFLIQPDPYDSITVDSSKNPPAAGWSGVDATIIKQRHDFLRPDSLVAIIALTDENDSEVDARAISGTGFNFMLSGFQPPRGTSQCDTNPGDPNCTSCGFPSTPQTDPNCQKTGGKYSAANDWGFDPNLRHVHTKAKYGVDYQYPIERYINGLTKTKIPDRNGEYPAGSGNYVGNADCTNPLYAASLPDGSTLDTQSLCNLTVGFQRTPDLVFFGIIGGVPNQLLHYDGTDASLALTPADWTKILGNNPETFDYTGIDPHMIEAFSPRTGLAPATGANNADPINGREWITDSAGAQAAGMPFNVDREYACIFQLTTPRDCTQGTNASACDCPKAAPSGLPAGSIPPVCDSTNPTSQVAAKVYPTPRELLLAHKMGDQGIASSLCPIHINDNATKNDPLYGYRPAVAAIVSRLKNALAAACLPQALTADSNGNVPCLILEALPPGSGTCASANLQDADPKQAAAYQATLNAESGSGDGGASTVFTICQVPQLVGNDLTNGTCVDNTKAGWCYVTGAAAGGGCAQAIKFSQGGNPSNGARVSLQCIQQTGTGDGGGASTSTGDGG
jgi:hypothetical protein